MNNLEVLGFVCFLVKTGLFKNVKAMLTTLLNKNKYGGNP